MHIHFIVTVIRKFMSAYKECIHEVSYEWYLRRIPYMIVHTRGAGRVSAILRILQPLLASIYGTMGVTGFRCCTAHPPSRFPLCSADILVFSAYIAHSF